MRNRLKGITLIETMLYIGLFSIIILIVLNFMLSTQESTIRNNKRGDVYKTSEFVIQHIEYSFNNALSISKDNSIFNSTLGVLELQFSEGSKQYTLSNSTLYFDGVPITPPNISITKFSLIPIYNGGDLPIAVKIDIDLVSKDDPKITDTINLLSTLR
jgi:hypothetical protein